MDGILGRIDAVINGPTPNLSSHLINYDGRRRRSLPSQSRSHRLNARLLGLEGRRTRMVVVGRSSICSKHSLEA